VAEPARVLAEPAVGRAIRIGEQRARTILQVSAFHGRTGAVTDALRSALGIEPVREVGKTATEGGLTLFTVGPGRVWVMGVHGSETGIDPEFAAIVDQSHGRAVLAVEGERIRDLLAKGCRIDLHPEVFAAGRCAQTLLGPFAVLLHCLAPTRFEIHVARSYAHSLHEWLQDAALEFESDVTT
jgi:sarcosine oxidase subunit gamma